MFPPDDCHGGRNLDDRGQLALSECRNIYLSMYDVSADLFCFSLKPSMCQKVWTVFRQDLLNYTSDWLADGLTL